jgi:hypothetical protein
VDDHLRAVDMLDLEPHDLARTQSGAIAKAQQQTVPERAGHRQQAFRLVLIEDHRNLLRLLDVVDLEREIVPPQRHAEQEAQARHGGIARDGANTGLGKMQLEQTDVVGRRRIG